MPGVAAGLCDSAELSPALVGAGEAPRYRTARVGDVQPMVRRKWSWREGSVTAEEVSAAGSFHDRGVAWGRVLAPVPPPTRPALHAHVYPIPSYLRRQPRWLSGLNTRLKKLSLWRGTSCEMVALLRSAYVFLLPRCSAHRLMRVTAAAPPCSHTAGLHAQTFHNEREGM